MKYQYWLARTLTNSKKLLLHSMNIGAEEAYGFKDSEWEKIKGITGEELQRIRDSKVRWDPDLEWKKLQEKGISFTTLEQSDYPRKLRPVYNAPYALYYTGKLPDGDRMQIAIVGARGRSAYGCAIASQLAEALGRSGIDVVSGLAMGIDTDGHTGCIKGGGSTFAVLGCGVDVVYPKSNAWLYPKINACGGIISEFPPGTQPIARQFPGRNRIISGLSDKVVVIEAREKSGSLITADAAMEQGRDVYALPGRITDSLSQGTNRLISQGAGALISVEDFMKELHIATGEICTQLDFRKNLLENEELLVYSLFDFQPLGLNALMGKLSMQLDELLPVLAGLKEKGYIRECAPNYFVKA